MAHAHMNAHCAKLFLDAAQSVVFLEEGGAGIGTGQAETPKIKHAPAGCRQHGFGQGLLGGISGCQVLRGIGLGLCVA